MDKVNRVLGLYFSPAGSTRKVVAFAVESLARRLGVPSVLQGYTTPRDRERWAPIAETDLVVWGTPVYAGRVPNKTLEFVDRLVRGCGNPVVLLAVYGGRHYDDALAEMAQLAVRGGMRVVGAAAMVSRHVFSSQLAQGRPDADDWRELEQFCARVEVERADAPAVPGGAKELQYYTPLREDGAPARFLKAVPFLREERCMVCGKCVDACPMGSIRMLPSGTPEVSGVCIKCMACVTRCPEDAWSFADEDFLSHIRMLESRCERHASNWFSD